MAMATNETEDVIAMPATAYPNTSMDDDGYGMAMEEEGEKEGVSASENSRDDDEKEMVICFVFSLLCLLSQKNKCV